MLANYPEGSRYTEAEALTEAERLSDIISNSDIVKNYDEAEDWLKITGREVRPKFSEEDFREAHIILNKFLDWDWELTGISELEREKEIQDNIPKLLERSKILKEACESGRVSLYDIMQLTLGGSLGFAGGAKEKEETQKIGLEIITELIPRIVKDNKADRADLWSIEAISLLAGSPSSSEEQQKTAVNALVASQNIIEKNFLDKNKASSSLNALKLMRTKGTDEQARQATEIALKVAEQIKGQPDYGRIVAFLLKSESPEDVDKGLQMVDSVLRQYNLPLDCLYSWKKSGTEIPYIVERNIVSIIELENRQPGICEFLYKEFGVADFGRYPVDLLLKQYEEKDNLENPYGVILFPRDDWNGAFYQDWFALGKLLEKLKDLGENFSLRVFECDGKIDVVRALIKLNKKYNPADGSGHKISLAIIGGHGTEDSIQFGGNKERSVLRSQDLLGKGARRASDFFEEYPTIILNSCSTGADKGIGEKLAEVIGAKVIAPKAPTNVTEIQVGKNRGGKFRFNVKYSGGEKDLKKIYSGAPKKSIPNEVKI